MNDPLPIAPTATSGETRPGLPREAAGMSAAGQPTADSGAGRVESELAELRRSHAELLGRNVELAAELTRFSGLYDHAPVAYVSSDSSGRIVRANLTLATMLGVDRANLLGQRLADFVWEADREEHERRSAVLFESGTPQSNDLRLRRADQTALWVHVEIVRGVDPVSGTVARLTANEITQRKQAEQWTALANEVLRILNDPQTLPDATQRILGAIKRATGFDAVGLRLRQGEDFPYLAADGFSAEFIEAESHLAMRHPDGGLCRDTDGRVRLECTCGLILSGQVDSSNPLFTAGGSAWTNDARPFLHLPPQSDPRLHPRNRCIHEGFKSVALIPIRTGMEIIGLLQLNDRRTDCFTLPMIEFFEGLVASIGLAVVRKQAAATLREERERLAGIIEGANVGTWEWNVQTGALTVNERWAEIIGFRLQELAPLSLATWQQRVHPDDLRACDALLERHFLGEVPYYAIEVRMRHKDGSWVWVMDRGRLASRDDAGHPLVMRGSHSDITSRKRAEAILASRIRLMAFAVSHSLPELLRATLDEAEALTGSTIGFYHFMEPDQQTLSLQAWSSNTVRNMCTADGAGRHYSVDQAGVWVDCVRTRRPTIHNDYAALAHRKGLPVGHAPVARELVVPVLREGQIKAILGVGNKPTDYAEQDVETVNLLADMAWDLAEKKRVDEALQRSEQHLALAQRAAGAGMWLWDMSTDRLEWTPELFRLFGLVPDEDKAGFAAWRAVIHPDDREAAEAGVLAAVRDHEPLAQEYRVVLPGGGIRWISAVGDTTYAPDGAALRMAGLCIDITAQKQAHERLREVQERYQVLFERAPDGIALTTLDGGFVAVNEAFATMHGYTTEDVYKQRLADLHGAGGPAAGSERMARILAGEALHFETEHRHKTGRVFPVEVTASLVVHAGQRLVQAFLRDVTSRKQAEAERDRLEAQNRQLQKAESLGRMAGAVAHHFNNQLQAVLNYLELARSEPVGTTEAATYINDAIGAVGKAATVSRSMLTYLGQSNALLEPLDLAAVCRRCQRQFEVGVLQGSTFHAQIPTRAVIVKGSERQLEQAVVHLVTNACEALGDRSGVVRLSLSVVRATELPAGRCFPADWLPHAQEYACLEVADTGCGILPTDLDQVFDPFFTSKFLGRGLGLPTVLGILRFHSGAISVTSDPGRGSTFRMLLPLVVEAMPARPAPVPVQCPVGPGGTVLVLDDESSVRFTVRYALEHAGYKVLDAADGEQGMALFRNHREEVVCVVSDLTMPRRDGWEVLADVRALAPRMPVILCSGYSEEQILAGRAPNGELPNACLTKPFTLRSLRETLAQALATTTTSAGR